MKKNIFQEDLTKETLVKQFKIVKTETNTSHVQQYGNKVRDRIVHCSWPDCAHVA